MSHRPAPRWQASGSVASGDVRCAIAVSDNLIGTCDLLVRATCRCILKYPRNLQPYALVVYFHNADAVADTRNSETSADDSYVRDYPKCCPSLGPRFGNNHEWHACSLLDGVEAVACESLLSTTFVHGHAVREIEWLHAGGTNNLVRVGGRRDPENTFQAHRVLQCIPFVGRITVKVDVCALDNTR